MAYQYTKKVIDYFKNPKNVGELEKPDAKATEGSAACGDMMTVTMKVDPTTHVIKDIKFKSFGCASNIATASIITTLAKGKTLEAAKKIAWDDAAKELGSLPPVKMHCSVLATETIRSAIRDYELKHGLIKGGDFKLTADVITGELRHVMNPEIGVDIIRLKMIKDIKIENGKVTIVLSQGNTDDRYMPSIESEIKEHVGVLPGVRELILDKK